MRQVRTRVAPSPTGYPHLGLVYQALFDWVLARKYDGKFVLRIEDTDRSRFVEGAEDIIYNSFSWVNLMPDEGPNEGGEYGPYRQSERLDLYQKYANQLIESGHAYKCFCTKDRLDDMRQKQEENHQAPMYDKTCRNLEDDVIKKNMEDSLPYVIRMIIPENQKIVVHDEVVGDVEFDSNQIDDQVILKSDGFPTYHLAVVVDDYLMKITHVFRGTEWIPSFPKHQLLWDFLGWRDDMPQFIHIPLLLNSEGPGKLSKRHAHTSVDYYRNEGFLPEAVVNYLANIVWNHPEGKEIFPIMDFGKALDLENNKFDIQSHGVKFDLNKLLWMNGEYIRNMSDAELVKRLEAFYPDHSGRDLFPTLVPLIKERIKTLKEFGEYTDFIFEKPTYQKIEEYRLKIKDLGKTLDAILEKLEVLAKPWTAEDFEQVFRKLAQELDLPVRDTFQLIRVAVSGKLVTPPLFESIQILGEDETIERVKEAKEFFG